jgi:diguanylate cyclase (GGDEF)-like protein
LVAPLTDRLTQYLLRQIVEQLDQPLLLVDVQQEELLVVLGNHALAAVVGRAPETLPGLPLTELLAVATPAPSGPEIRAVLEGGAELSLRVREATASGAERGVQMCLKPLCDKGGSLTHAVGLLQGWQSDGDGAPSSSARFAEAVGGPDRVTGLATRPAIEGHLEKLWQRAAAGGEHLSLLFFVVDDFSAYVQTFGEQAGNSALRLVAHSIAGSLRRSDDLAGRYGSEEFIGVVPGAEGADALALAERIAWRVKALCVHHPRSEVSRYLTVSGGVADQSEAGDGWESVLQLARSRALKAREGGGAQVFNED